METSIGYSQVGHANAKNLKLSHKIVLLGSLYLSQGVPFGFFTQAFPSLMRKQGYSLEAISIATVLALPWAAKFLWAPAVDRFSFRGLGRRKSWLVPLQVVTSLTLLAVALVPDNGPSITILIVVFLVNLMIASQDIAADALAVDIIHQKERGIANGIQVAGYRLGMVVGGGLLLIVYDGFGWTLTFASMAVLILVASVPVLSYRELPYAMQGSGDGTGIRAFVRRPGVSYVILLIAIYKFGEAFAGGMVRPFLVDRGLSLTDIGAMLGVVGFGAILLGGLAGGAMINMIGRRNALAGFAVLQAISIAGYAYLSAHSSGRTGTYAVCAAENFASGMANAALFTCMMDWSTKETGATDYTVQASTMVIASGIAATLSGFSAGSIGYMAHFILASALAAGAVVAVLCLYKKTPKSYPFSDNPCLG